MKYERGEPTLNENTITIPVTYYFENGTKEQIDVPIFVTTGMTLDDIEQALSNRGVSHQNDMDNVAAAKELFEKLQSK